MSVGKHALTILPCLFVADIFATRCYGVASSDLQKLGLCADKAFQLCQSRSLRSLDGGFRVTRSGWWIRHIRGGELTWKFEREAESLACQPQLPQRSATSPATKLSPTKLHPGRQAFPTRTIPKSSGKSTSPSQFSGSSTILRFTQSRNFDNTAAMVRPRQSQIPLQCM